MKSSGEKIGKLRKRTGESQGDFGAKLGVSQSTVSGWEKDAAAPKVEMIPQVARLLNCTVDYLLDESDEREPAEVEAEMRVRGQAAIVGWAEIERRVIVNAGQAGDEKSPAPAPGQGAEAGAYYNLTVRKDQRGRETPEVTRKDPTRKGQSEPTNR